MKTPTFREQYDKIVGAYLRNELRPYHPCACFVGNLLNNTLYWGALTFMCKKGTERYTLGCKVAKEAIEREARGFYTPEEIFSLEGKFLLTIEKHKGADLFSKNSELWEEALFAAMQETLLLLKQIHESKGEIVEDYTFNKRVLEEVPA